MKWVIKQSHPGFISSRATTLECQLDDFQRQNTYTCTKRYISPKTISPWPLRQMCKYVQGTHVVLISSLKLPREAHCARRGATRRQEKNNTVIENDNRGRPHGLFCKVGDSQPIIIPAYIMRFDASPWQFLWFQWSNVCLLLPVWIKY